MLGDYILLLTCYLELATGYLVLCTVRRGMLLSLAACHLLLTSSQATVGIASARQTVVADTLR